MRAELAKVRTARTLLAVPVVAVAYALLAFVPALTLSDAALREQLDSTSLLAVARGPGVATAVLMLLLGVLATAGEFRHGTVAATLLVTPRRSEALRDKALAVAAVAAGTALAVEAVAVTFGTVFLRSKGFAIDVGAGDVLLTVVGTVVAAVLYALAGVGLGYAVRDQTAAVGVALAWVGIVEGAVPLVLRRQWLFRWMPGGAANAVVGAADAPPDLLPAWAGALLLVAVAGALVAAGGAAFGRRDV